MAIIPQKKLFAWTEIQPLGDLKRLQLVLDYMPDEDLVRTLEKKAGTRPGRLSGTRRMEFHFGRNSIPTPQYRRASAGVVAQRAITGTVRV